MNYPATVLSDLLAVLFVFILGPQVVRDQWAKVVEARNMRDELRECYRREGVNYRENCRCYGIV